MRRLPPLVALASLMTITSCDSARTITPPQASGTHRSMTAEASPEFAAFESPASVTRFLGVTDSSNSAFSATDIDPYPTPTVVTIAATGLLELRWIGGFALPPAGSVAGQIDPGGRRTGFNNDGCTEVSMVAMIYVPPGQTAPTRAWSGCQDGLGLNFTGNAIVAGEVTLSRSSDGSPSVPGRCGGVGFGPCFTYHLGHNVSLTRVPATFAVSVEDGELQPGQSATFETTVTPATIGQVAPRHSQTVATPFTPLEWRYIPDGGGAEIVVTSCGANRTCDFIPPGNGTMRLTAVVNGDVQAQDHRLEVELEKVEIMAIENRLPTVTIPAVSKCTTAMIRVRTTPIRVKVTRGGAPVANRQVRLTVTAEDEGGGHVAATHIQPRPWGSMPNDIVTTDGTGNARVTWTKPEFSGPVRIRAELIGASGLPAERTDTLTFGPLVELPQNPLKYERIGIITDMHPRSHFGLPTLITELERLADSTTQPFGPFPGFIIEINDLSLPLGGRFDVTASGADGGRWNDSPHHCSHRFGNAADFRSHNLSPARRKRVLLMWVALLNHSVYEEGDHWHLKLERDPDGLQPPAPEQN